MPNNSTVTPNTFNKMFLMHLGGALNTCRNMSTEVKKSFGKPKDMKPGAVVDVRKPYRFQVTDGLNYQPQPLVDVFFPVKVAQVKGVHFEWDSVEKTLSIREVSELYAKPAAIAMASVINAGAAKFIALNTFNAVGTPGTVPVDEQPYLAAGDKIVEMGLPEGEELTCILNRKMSSKFVTGAKTLFNPAGSIGGQWDKGRIADSTLGYKFQRDQTIYSRKVGPLGGSPLVDTVQTAEGGNNATMTLKTRGWTASAASRLLAGDRFTIANVNAVHPQTRQSTGSLQQFVVLANASSDGSGNIAALSIAPAITPTGVAQNVDAAPVDGAVITVDGAANTVSPQGILMHKNAYAFVSVPLSNPEPGMGALVASETDPETGLSTSFIRAFDPVRRVEVTRFDCLFDYAVMYREMASCIES